MRILIPYFASPDSFQDNVAFTLKALGHEVLCAPQAVAAPRHPLLRAAEELSSKAFPARWSRAERWVVGMARHWRAEMVLCLTQSLRDEVLFELRRLGVRHLIAWWGDTPANMKGLGLLAEGWSKIFIKDAAAVSKFRAVGLDAELLHEAMNPVWHRRTFSRIVDEVVVAGNYYGYRQFLVSRLLDLGLPMSLYGPNPPSWSLPSIKAIHRDKYIVKREKSRIFGEAIACLNSTALSEADSLNCRAFEIAGACGLQLIEEKPAVSTCFDPGYEVLTYRSVDEIVALVEKARKDPEWSLRIREAGHARAHAHHTYEQRLSRILTAVVD